MSSPDRPRVHGGPVAAELAALGLAAADVIDFSVNVNPYGPAPAVAAAARGADVSRYPEPRAETVRAALAARWRVEPGGVLFAHGAAELLWDLARHVARAGRRALVVEPAFSEFRAGVAAAGGDAIEWSPDPARGLSVDFEAVSERLASSGAAAAYLASPTSPAGAAVPSADVARLARAHPHVLFVLDESFLALSDRHAEADVTLPLNVARVRSLTKEHAIPGLRVGYLLADPGLIAALDAARPTWSTSAPAQAAALAALGEEPFVAASRARLSVDREALRQGLARLGLEAPPSVAPYLVFRAGDGAALRRRLLARRVLVRDCTSFGLPGFVRVAARPAQDREVFLASLEKELS
ncbi:MULTISPECIES: aminotransferase class I/II-fold pyridoxal phosphate-dependent enzyme [Anaeromyxobacter]|uniref:aminotransferase class I/II-fold pyridoxal phosphate-dependent enzyme n=1 Tax=Anaeromyxobacter TaxID=161492 RepID=UPI001F57F3D6|nr:MULTISPECIES: aminotransferase class I/II-fold pyridoxal phosphate-dependent enzyme [unclassified Anaeromyxobacter]